MKIFEKEFIDLPGLDPNIDVSGVKERSVSITIKKEQIEKLRDGFGIDVTAMVQNTIFNEIYIEIGRSISKKVLEGEFLGEIEDLFKFLKKREEDKELYKYIITNNHAGAIMSDYPGFVSSSLNMLDHAGAPYLIGMIGESYIYVDPYLEFSDLRLGMFSEDFWNYKDIAIQLITEGSSSSDISAKYRIKINDPKSELYLINKTLNSL